ncbi:MAG: hypothetical protein U1F83_17705 [Verrucomicrobiota bacterium]
MKKIVLGIIIGVLIGGAATWSLLQATKSEPPEARSAEAEKHETGLHLTKEQQTAAGLVIAKPERTEVAAETKAFGRVLDATPLAALLAEIETADSAAAASAKEWERLKSLGDNASARALETAEAAMKRDRAAAESAHGRLFAGWGKALAGRADLASLTRQLLAQEIALARADLPAGETLDGTPSEARVAPVTGEAAFQAAELIGPAPNADPQAQGQAFLILLREQPPAPGTALTVRLSSAGAAEKGFLLPRTAVVQHESGMFVFVQTGDEQFERKPVEEGPPQREGVFVKSGIKIDERIVMTGAQQLLSEEFKAANGGE